MLLLIENNISAVYTKGYGVNFRWSLIIIFLHFNAFLPLELSSKLHQMLFSLERISLIFRRPLLLHEWLCTKQTASRNKRWKAKISSGIAETKAGCYCTFVFCTFRVFENMLRVVNSGAFMAFFKSVESSQLQFSIQWSIKSICQTERVNYLFLFVLWHSKNQSERIITVL